MSSKLGSLNQNSDIVLNADISINGILSGDGTGNVAAVQKIPNDLLSLSTCEMKFVFEDESEPRTISVAIF